jgi:PTS system nitrogen regulatory IIA component
MIDISEYMDAGLIAFIDSGSRETVLEALIEMLNKKGKLNDREAFRKAIFERERIVSTGIGMGVAVPHAKLSGYDDFFIAVGILKNGIDWQALDNVPVRLVFMIGGPENKQTAYLRLLSNLTSLIKDEERRKKMLTLNSKEAIIQLFSTIK